MFAIPAFDTNGRAVFLVIDTTGRVLSEDSILVQSILFMENELLRRKRQAESSATVQEHGV